MAKTQQEKMEILSYQDALNALKIYTEMVKQIAPAVHDDDRGTITKYNTHIEVKLKMMES